MHRGGGALLLVALLCLCVAGQEADEGAVGTSQSKEGVESTALAQVRSDANGTEAGDGKAAGGDDDSPAKLFVNKARSTTTWTFLSSFTSIVPYTCYTTGAGTPQVCMGRRIRRSRKLVPEWELKADSTRLYGSANEEQEPFDLSERDARDAKFFFRVWTTVSTTATITTFSTNRSVTISVSILCTFAGMAINTC